MALIPYLLVALAAICNAVMDTVKHRFHDSVFKNLDQQWWNPAISWMNKYTMASRTDMNAETWVHRRLWIFKYPAALTDAWHLFKSLMVAFMIGAIAAPTPDLFRGLLHFGTVLHFVLLGVVWVLVFNLFYNKVLRR